MSLVCDVCGRGTSSSFTVSHSKVRAKRTQKINLQSKKLDGKRAKVCTKCIKTMNKKAK